MYQVGDIVIRDLSAVFRFTKFGHDSIGEIIGMSDLGNYEVRVIHGENGLIEGQEEHWAPGLLKPFFDYRKKPDWIL